MPTQKCKGGHKYGESGKCYQGKGSAKKASKQGVAIRISQQKTKKTES